MFIKLEVFTANGSPGEGFTFLSAGEKYINVKHIVFVSEFNDGFSRLDFHGGNAYVSMSYFVRMKPYELVKLFS